MLSCLKLNITGIPQQDLGELTGNLNPARRDKIWRSKRVFFLTPQVCISNFPKSIIHDGDELFSPRKLSMFSPITLHIQEVNEH